MFRKPKKRPKTSLLSKKKKLNESHANAFNGEPGKKRFRKRTSDSSDGSSDEEGPERDASTTSELLQQAKRNIKRSKFSVKDRRKSTVGALHHFESTDPSEQLSGKDLATREAEFHPLQANQNQSTEKEADRKDAVCKTVDEGNGDIKVYKGQNEARNKFLAGPLRAPAFVRITSRFDYQPDICKDYKETGFCGYGDTCIYLHDRGDSMTGWQLEAEWEERRKKALEKRQEEMENFAKGKDYEGVDGCEKNEDKLESLENDGLPFACHLCRKAFQHPIVTKCGHYFCQSCIIHHVQSTQACPICNKDMMGVFNHPTKLIFKKRKLLSSRATWEEFADIMKKGV